jgi:hypothetical protein
MSITALCKQCANWPRLREISALLFVFTVSAAASEPADKSEYHLFNPTPRPLMRELSTDRPDKTESAYTVDAGHFQFEMDIVSYGYDRYNTDRLNVRDETIAIAPINLKLGLLNNVDLQMIIEPYLSARTRNREAPRSTERRHGFGDITVRTKVNVWGNDGGTTAMAIMPFVKLPTNQHQLGNNSVEGGIIFPLAVELPQGWSMGVMTEIDFIRDEQEGGGHHPEFINSITFSHDIVGALGGYAEFFSMVSTESGSDWVGTLDFGLTYGLTDDIQLDGGVNIGLTRSAEDISPFIGISWRF